MEFGDSYDKTQISGSGIEALPADPVEEGTSAEGAQEDAPEEEQKQPDALPEEEKTQEPELPGAPIPMPDPPLEEGKCAIYEGVNYTG